MKISLIELIFMAGEEEVRQAFGSEISEKVFLRIYKKLWGSKRK